MAQKRKYMVAICEYKRQKISEYRDAYFTSRAYDKPLDFDWKLLRWEYEEVIANTERTTLVSDKTLDEIPELIKSILGTEGWSELAQKTLLSKVIAMPYGDVVSIWIPSIKGEHPLSSFTLEFYAFYDKVVRYYKEEK